MPISFSVLIRPTPSLSAAFRLCASSANVCIHLFWLLTLVPGDDGAGCYHTGTGLPTASSAGYTDRARVATRSSAHSSEIYTMFLVHTAMLWSAVYAFDLFFFELCSAAETVLPGIDRKGSVQRRFLYLIYNLITFQLS